MNFEVKEIKSGNKIVLAWGTILTLPENPLVIKFGSTKDTFSLKLDFLTDNSNTRSIETDSPVNNELQLRLFNFNNDLGVGFTTPIEIAELNSKKIYFSIRSHTMGDSKQQSFTYTFYQDE